MIWRHCRIILYSVWHDFAITVKDFGIILESFWDHFGVILRSVSNDFRFNQRIQALL